MFKDFYLNIKLEGKDAKLPDRANPTDAGMDVFATKDYEIEPGKDCLIPLDWSCEFPDGYAMIVKEKSGRAVKNKLDVGACIDGNECIITEDGVLPAKEIKNPTKILAYNQETKKVEFKMCDGFSISNKTETLKLTFMNGTTLICSKDHRILTDKGWVKAEDLHSELVITMSGRLELKFKEFDGIKEVYSTNVEDLHNYITQNGITNHNCVIDSSYRGIVHVHLFNNGDEKVIIKKGEKIAQMIIVPIWTGIPEKVDSLDENTSRGKGGFGSTGLK